MTESLKNKIVAKLPSATDILFILFLITEWLCKHTLLSQAALALFALSVIARIVTEKKIRFHSAFLFFGLVILWGLIGAFSAIRVGSALSMVRTLLIDLVFLFLFYQYLLFTDTRRFSFLYMGAGLAFLLLVILLSFPHPFDARLGQKANVNPNDVAIVAGMVFAFALCLQLGERGTRPKGCQLLWGLMFIPMMVLVFFTSSLKGYLLIFGILCLYYLFRYPKKWGLKLLILFFLCCALLYVLTMEHFLSRWPGIYYRITIRLQKIVEYLKGGGRHRQLSIMDRANYFSVGTRALNKRPILGWGLDCFKYLDGANGTYSHCNYIELLASGGWPMMILFYIPFIAAILRSFRNKKRSSFESLFLSLVLLQLPLDFAMVSYYDRATLLIPVLLYAESEKGRGAKNRWSDLDKFIKNPCRVLAAAGSKGRLKLLPSKLYVKLCYRGRVGHKLDLKDPKGMTEKLQWMKLYDKNKIYPILCDKMAVRSFVRERVGEDVLVPLLGAWDRGEDIDFAALPNRFVLKCTHDSGGVRVCTDKDSFPREEAIAFLNDHIYRNYYWCGREWWYRSVPARILAEAFIGTEDGHIPDDYKFFCFNGKVRAACYCTNRVKAHADYYFVNPDFSLLPVNDITKDAFEKGITVPRPDTLDEMIALAEKLSAGFAQIRVDLFSINGKVYFGEMTLCDQSGFADDYVDDGDLIMGSWYDLPEKKK